MVTDAMKAIPLSSLDTATLAGAFLPITTGLPNAVLLLRIVNDSNRDVVISYDGGTTEHDYVPAGESLTINAQANNELPGKTSIFPKGMPVSAKGLAGTGYVYVSGYYT